VVVSSIVSSFTNASSHSEDQVNCFLSFLVTAVSGQYAATISLKWFTNPWKVCTSLNDCGVDLGFFGSTPSGVSVR